MYLRRVCYLLTVVPVLFICAVLSLVGLCGSVNVTADDLCVSLG